MAEFAKLADDRFAALLDSIHPAPTVALDHRREELREQVALLSAFDVASLSNLKGDRGRDPVLEDFLLEDCERVVTRRGPRWSLRGDVRVATLAELDRNGRLRNLEPAADQGDITYKMAELYIHAEAPPLPAQSVDQLQGTALAAEWLAGTSVSVPTPAEASAQQAIESMLHPLRMLVADGFAGRSHELQVLSDYAEVMPASSRLTGAARRVRRILRMDEQPPMLIHGPGGIGKSTLVARFVLDHVDGERAYRFPFAYLSFDRSELRIDQPLTLLAEAASQLALFFPEVEGDAAKLAQAAHETVSSLLASAADRRASKGSWTTERAQISSDERILIQRFGAVIDHAGSTDLPNVWVLDTFEVAQREAPRGVERLWDFLESLQEACPRLRVVICGRAPVVGQKTRDLALGGLDGPAAVELLEQQLRDLDLGDDFLEQIVRAVSTQPISLRLAVLLVRNAAQEGELTAERRRNLLFRLHGHEVEGVLYRRILDHIEDPDVRKVAHPGLVVRRLTPMVIKEVVAPRCGLGKISGERARELFDGLAREVGLVRRDGDALVQGREIRAQMLTLVAFENADAMANLRRAALQYYRERDTFTDKVEELYYRLALGQKPATLDKVFDLSTASLLADATDEFPPSSQVFLANRMGLTVDPTVLTHVDDESWALHAATTARRLLDAGDASAALEAVTERSGDAARRYVAVLEVEALAALHRYDDALSVARTASEWATDHDEPDMFIDVALLASRIEEDQSEYATAVRWAEDALGAATAIDDRVARCAARVAVVRVHRRTSRSDDPGAVAMRQALIDDASDLSARERARNPSLVRDLAAEIGDDVPKIARDALRLTGFTGPQRPRRRRRRDAADELTSVEAGDTLSEAFEGQPDADVSQSVIGTLQTEADEGVF